MSAELLFLIAASAAVPLSLHHTHTFVPAGLGFLL